MARQKLKMTALTKLALVDNPANQHASVTIAKRAEPATGLRARFAEVMKRFLDTVAPPATVLKEAETYGQARAVNELWEKNSALTTAISTIVSDDALSDDERRTKIDAALSAYRDDLLSIDVGAPVEKAQTCKVCGGTIGKGGMCNTNNDHVNGVAKADDAPAAAVKKEDAPAVGSQENPTAGGAGDHQQTEPSNGDRTMSNRVAKSFTELAQANAHIVELTTEIGTLDDKLEAEMANSDPMALVTKGMSAAAAKIVRKQHEDNVALRVQIADQGRVAKAAKITKGLTDDEGDKAALSLIKCLDGVASDEDRTAATTLVEKLFVQLSEVSKELEGLEMGGAGDDVTKDSNVKLDEAARAIMKTDTKLTYPQAVSKALAQDSSLYDGNESDDDDDKE